MVALARDQQLGQAARFGLEATQTVLGGAGGAALLCAMAVPPERLADYTARFAAVLDAQGVRSGDTVGVCITNRPEALLAVLATVKFWLDRGVDGVR